MDVEESAPLLFLHVGWMVRYAGADPTDPTRGNFGWLHGHTHGHEAFNFLPRSGRLYGYSPSRGQLRVERLGASKNDDHVDGILVIWIARNPSTNKTVIVGWYINARVYREYRRPTDQGAPHIENSVVEYRTEAASHAGLLLAPDARTFTIPTFREQAGGYGQSPTWYGLNDPNFRRSVLEYVKRDGSRGPSPPPHNPDPVNRRAIEQFAVDHATNYFRSREGGERQVMDVQSMGAVGI